MRARIEEAWGARAFDHAGMTEMGAYGFECAAQAGLHVNESEFIAEVIDPATGAPARRGRAGADEPRPRSARRCCATGPATACALAPAPCACGRTFLRLEGGILGRVDDMLIVRGVNVFPSALEGIVRRFPVVDEFLIEVYRRRRDGRGARSSSRSTAASAGGRAAVQEAVRVDLGIRVEVAPVPAGSLPRYELKARRLVRR